MEASLAASAGEVGMKLWFTAARACGAFRDELGHGGKKIFVGSIRYALPSLNNPIILIH